MLLFQRQLRVTGGPAAVAWATEITASVQKHASGPVALWMGSHGTAPGSVVWSAPLESLAQVDELNAKAAGDAAHNALLAKGAEYVADVDVDRLVAIVHGSITDSAPVGSYIGGVRAAAAPRKWGAAVEWAAHIANVYSEVTGLNVVVGSTVAGPMGEVSWFVRHENAASIEAAIGATMGSENYLTEVDGGGEYFLPGATQVFAQRIA
jgi:hypothetical protein